MDTSPEYIKMCDWPKIQKEWKPKNWKSYTLWHTRLKTVGDIIYGRDWEHSKGELVWLPLQWQIQEMMVTISKFWENIPPFFYNERLFFWNRQHKIQGDKTSMEQLWLAFYMHEKHSLIWRDGKWKKK